jgi:hypothetical protein
MVEVKHIFKNILCTLFRFILSCIFGITFFYVAIFIITKLPVKNIKFIVILLLGTTNGLAISFILIFRNKLDNIIKLSVESIFIIVLMIIMLLNAPAKIGFIKIENLLQNHISPEAAAHFGLFILFLEYVFIFTVYSLIWIIIFLMIRNKKIINIKRELIEK